ncbi:hypothetical protein DU478_03250 [Thalassococcus profundi]|uniref:Uncharacterized protein n=1 Tax=Thalassococcus profundi TaxID=2282382 RepID=A0A369TTC9_9RHOB|nr:hypothetical protein [Thalassococcus profundi]RDD67685.1 hypothetical protein DU478_03250 [Thalassococcus profundi]
MRLIPLLLILSACTVAGPGFRGIDPVPRSLGGNDFLIRQKGTVAEVIRTDRKMLPRFVPIATRAGLVVQELTGCSADWIVGDVSMLLVGVRCDGAPVPKKPRRPKSYSCDVLDAYRGAGGIDLALDCTQT